VGQSSQWSSRGRALVKESGGEDLKLKALKHLHAYRKIHNFAANMPILSKYGTGRH